MLYCFLFSFLLCCYRYIIFMLLLLSSHPPPLFSRLSIYIHKHQSIAFLVVLFFPFFLHLASLFLILRFSMYTLHLFIGVANTQKTIIPCIHTYNIHLSSQGIPCQTDTTHAQALSAVCDTYRAYLFCSFLLPSDPSSSVMVIAALRY